MAKEQKKAIQRHEVLITRGYICTLPKAVLSAVSASITMESDTSQSSVCGLR